MLESSRADHTIQMNINSIRLSFHIAIESLFITRR